MWTIMEAHQAMRSFMLDMEIFAGNDVAMTSVATGSKVPSTHNIPRILHITSSPSPRGRDSTDPLCTFSDLLWRDLCLRMGKSWSAVRNILLGREISPHAKYMNQSTSHPSTNDLNTSNHVGGAPGPWCPVARAGALLLTEPTVWSHGQIWTELHFTLSRVEEIERNMRTRLWRTRSIKEIRVVWGNGIHAY